MSDAPQAAGVCDNMVTLVKHYLTDGEVRLLPEDVAAGPVRHAALPAGHGVGAYTGVTCADETRPGEVPLPAELRRALESILGAPRGPRSP